MKTVGDDTFLKSLLKQVKRLSDKYDYNPALEDPEVEHVKKLFGEIHTLVDGMDLRPLPTLSVPAQAGMDTCTDGLEEARNYINTAGLTPKQKEERYEAVIKTSVDKNAKTVFDVIQDASRGRGGSPSSGGAGGAGGSPPPPPSGGARRKEKDSFLQSAHGAYEPYSHVYY
jgi:hypothetical protein